MTALQVLSSVFVPLLVKKVGASKGLAGMWDAQGTPSALSEFLGDLNKFVSQVHNTQQQLTGEQYSTVLCCDCRQAASWPSCSSCQMPGQDHADHFFVLLCAVSKADIRAVLCRR